MKTAIFKQTCSTCQSKSSPDLLCHINQTCQIKIQLGFVTYSSINKNRMDFLNRPVNQNPTQIGFVNRVGESQLLLFTTLSNYVPGVPTFICSKAVKMYVDLIQPVMSIICLFQSISIGSFLSIICHCLSSCSHVDHKLSLDLPCQSSICSPLSING